MSLSYLLTIHSDAMKKIIITTLLFFTTVLPTTCIAETNDTQDLPTISSICESDGIQPSGAIYRICMPESELWNGDLVLFAHGYIPGNKPLHIPEEQLLLEDGTNMSQRFNNLGYAFAATSYSTNGLAVIEGLKDLSELVDIFSKKYGQPRFVYLFGVSEGALITVLALERFPEIFDGGVAVCGMIGDYYQHTNYINDFRVVFDYFFPALIPGSVVDIPQEVIDNWSTIYVPKIIKAIQSDHSAVSQLLRVTKVPVDKENPSSVVKSIMSLLSMNVVSINDKIEKLGGNPFNNSQRYYRGSDNDPLLNRDVQRFTSEQIALDEIKNHYQTSGQLSRPLITLHNTKDPLVQYLQASLYRLKTSRENSKRFHSNIPILRYGHCNLEISEVEEAFNLLVSIVSSQDL